MFGELAGEFGESARVLVLELHPVRALRVTGGDRTHAFALDLVGKRPQS